MKCWTIRYYFRQGSQRRLLRGQFCDCVGGNTKAEAIASVSPIEMDACRTLVRVTATPSRKGHYCATNEGSNVTEDLKSTYTIRPARYAKGKMAVYCKPDPSGEGWKMLAATIISGMPGVTYSHRERSYICSPSRAAKFEAEITRAQEVSARQELIDEAHAAGRAIDHIDGDPTNNDLSNLRVVTLEGER